ncbi:MAG TPA: HupE/UreJ family protein [Candidatus Baltobacteraceae bacterium]|nr:HupE/UreJ family protein [Candidatus Baltobacteraceae bacterium]
MRAPRQCRKGARLFLVFALGATTTEAHLVTTGLGPVYDGIGHLLLSLDDVLPVVGLALFAGLRGPKAGRLTLLFLPLIWIAGAIAGLANHGQPILGQIFTACSFLVLGILIAADWELPTVVVAALAVLVGGVHGFFNGVAMRGAGLRPALLQLTGIAVMLFILVAVISGFVVSLPRAWMRIVIRVVGSWIAAIGLLSLGWSLRFGQ